MKRIQVLGLAFVFALSLSACSGNEPSISNFQVRDSAGLQIVENQSASWVDGEGWFVDPSPELSIGSAQGEELFQFFRITDAALISDGRIVVAEGGSGQLKVFGPDGAHQVTMGGQGDGPGEFRSFRLRIISATPDGITVFDDRLNRVTEFSTGGELRETTPVGVMESGPVPLPIGDLREFGEDAWVGMDGNVLAAGSSPSLVRDTAHFFLLKKESEEDRLIAAIPGAWTEYTLVDGHSGVRTQPMTPTPSWDTGNGELFLSKGESFEFQILSATGEVDLIVRLLKDPPRLTPADVQEWRNVYLSRVPEEDRAPLHRLLDALTLPDQLPAYAALHVDPLGYLWAGHFRIPGTGPIQDWDIYAEDGVYLGAVSTPPGLSVFEIGDDRVLGTWADDTGVQYVQVHRLIRGD